MLSKSLRCAWVAIVSLFILLAPSLMAQTASTGAIKGTVTDSSNAVVPNATVLARNIGTGATRTVTTGSDGAYVLSLLPLGTYSLKIDAAGFKSETIPSVTVNVAETTALNAVLQVGAQTTQVTVQEQVEEVNTTNATLGTVIASTTTTALPLNTRNYTNLLGLSAGANSNVFNATTLGKGTTDIAVNGANVNQNSIYMDGFSITNSNSSGSLVGNTNDPGIGLVEPDAIQEFKIQTSLFDAGQGRNVGASINVVTKTGTNEFHGSAFEFFRNTVLNANDFFRNQAIPPSPNSRPVLNQNQYGGTFGGPIKKDKFFFFTSYQQTWQKNGAAPQGLTNAQFLPIPGTDGKIGDPRGTPGNPADVAAMQAALGAEFCPGQTPGTNDGGTTKFGGVQINCVGTNINPVAVQILQLKNPDGTYLVPSAPASVAPTSNGVTTASKNLGPTSIPARFSEEQLLQNLDYVINTKNTLSAHYFFSHDPQQVPFGCGQAGSVTAIGVCYPDTAYSDLYSNHYVGLQLTSIVTNNLVNEVRVGFQRGAFRGNSDTPFMDQANCPGATAANSADIQAILGCALNTMDAVIVNGIFQIGSPAGLPSNKFFTTWEAGDQVSWTRGKHTVRFGGEYERDRYDWTFGSLSIGQLTFQSFPDFLLGLPGCPPGSTTCNVANPNYVNSSGQTVMTNGSPDSNVSSSGNFQSLTPGSLNHNYRGPFADLWIQDDIKLTRKLTMNLGVRWEYQAVQIDSKGFATNIYPSLINSVPIPGNSETCPNPNLLPGVTCTPGTLAGFVVPSNFPYSEFPAPPVGGLVQSPHKGFMQNNTPLDAFAPRLGFAWSPLDSNKLTVRSGVGIFDDRPGAITFIGAVEQAIPYSTPLFQQSPTANWFSSLAAPYLIPPSVWTDRWVNFTPAPGQGNSSNLSNTFAFPGYNRIPQVYEWNLTVQYEFLPTWTFEGGYVGSHGIHQEALPGTTGQQANEPGLVGNPLGTNNGWTPYPGIACGAACGVTSNTIANASLRVPYLGFAPGGLSETNDGETTKYNSAQAAVRKQFSHGVQVQAAYTWSRSFVSLTSYNDPDIFQYLLNPAYHPQRLTLNYLWNIPANYQGMLGKVANGWGVSGVTIVQNGVPLTVTNGLGGTIFALGGAQSSTGEFCPGMGNGNVASPGGTQQRLGGINGGEGWFNKAAFTNTVGVGAPTTSCGSLPQIGNGTGWGDVGRANILGPGQFNWDISLFKTTRVGGIREDATLQFRTEFFNAFNHPQFNNPTVLDSSQPTFGQITNSSVNPRLIQFGLKYIF